MAGFEVITEGSRTFLRFSLNCCAEIFYALVQSVEQT
jgi:hypothetical protein